MWYFILANRNIEFFNKTKRKWHKIENKLQVFTWPIQATKKETPDKTYKQQYETSIEI